MKKYIYLSFLSVFLILTPTTLHAYLDPGTGNVLVYLLVALFSTVAYSLRGFLYKIQNILKKNKTQIKEFNNEEIVIFSEGKQYWLTFKPIIEALLEKEMPFRYLTTDIEDPALTIAHPNMNSRYIGEKSAAFGRTRNVRAKVMLATTPNIGTPNYPMPVPPHIKCLTHVFHGIGGLDTYEKYSLDNYHAVLLAAESFENSIRKLEKMRNLPNKECFSVGIPYLDVLAKNLQNNNNLNIKPEKNTILIAPSWGEKSCLTLCGEEIIPKLLKENYKIIFRPHPQSKIAEPKILNSILKNFENKTNFQTDFNIEATNAMNRAEILISDKSGIRFDFAFLYEKPVLTINMEVVKNTNYEAADLGQAWEDIATEKIGLKIEPNNLKEIVNLVEKTINFETQKIIEFREESIINFGSAGPKVAQWLIDKAETLE